MGFSCCIYLKLTIGWEDEGVYSQDLEASLNQENAASKYSNHSNLISQDCFHSG